MMMKWKIQKLKYDREVISKLIRRILKSQKLKMDRKFNLLELKECLNKFQI